MGDNRPKANLLRAAEIIQRADRFSHPWNPNSEVYGLRLSNELGLRRTGVSVVRLPAGKESFAYHSHTFEEEWIYILHGKGTAIIDGSEHEVGAGDFMAFPTPSVAHHMKNTSEEDLFYLMGGEAREFEVSDFPELGRRMVRVGGVVRVYPIDGGEPFPPVPPGEEGQ